MPEVNSEFYVGYQPVAPPSIGRVIWRTVAGIAGIVISVALILVLAQAPFAASRFEYGVYRDYQGELAEWPYPMLITQDATYLLVGPGKFGIANQVHGHDGAWVSLRGALISRGSSRMLEVDLESLRISSERAHPTRAKADLGEITLTGEIVDTKCHLGVMNPGDGKVHRDCAARCISGGAPPGFLVRDQQDETRLLLLTGSDGRAIGPELLDYVAEPVRIPGHLLRLGTTLILQTEPRDFRRE
jgi:hypothetical protein